ncbi:MAG: hypothetical protein V8T10_09935 [Merdibacter sp.]
MTSGIAGAGPHETGVISGGMIPKVQCCIKRSEQGVNRQHRRAHPPFHPHRDLPTRASAPCSLRKEGRMTFLRDHGIWNSSYVMQTYGPRIPIWL